MSAVVWFDGEKVQDGHAGAGGGGKVKRVAPAGEFAGFGGEKVDTAGGTADPGHDRNAMSIRFSAARGTRRGSRAPVGGAARGARHGVHAQPRWKAASPPCVTAAARTISNSPCRDAFNAGRFLGPTCAVPAVSSA